MKNWLDSLLFSWLFVCISFAGIAGAYLIFSLRTEPTIIEKEVIKYQDREVLIYIDDECLLKTMEYKDDKIQ